MDEPCHQDDGQDDQHEPYEEQHDAGNRVPGYGLSSHGCQLPADTWLIRPIFRILGRPFVSVPGSGIGEGNGACT
jgi:hypothetical protein